MLQPLRPSFHFLAALLGVPAMLFALPETPPTAPPAEPAPAEKAPAAPAEPACTVPAEAAGFRGKVTGVVETIHERQTSFKLKITRAEPGGLDGKGCCTATKSFSSLKPEFLAVLHESVRKELPCQSAEGFIGLSEFQNSARIRLT